MSCLSLKLVKIIRNHVSLKHIARNPVSLFFLWMLSWQWYSENCIKEVLRLELSENEKQSETLYLYIFPIPSDLKNFPNMSYIMESGKSILQVLGKRRLILLCGGEQLFMISPGKNESSQHADSQAHPSIPCYKKIQNGDANQFLISSKLICSRLKLGERPNFEWWLSML